MPPVHPECENQEIINGMICANRVLGFINAPAFMQNAVSTSAKREYLYCLNIAARGITSMRTSPKWDMR